MSIIEKSNSGRLIDEDFTQVAELLGCEPAALKAVQQVETGGRGGFFSPGRPAILFEGHIFWTQLKKMRISFILNGKKDTIKVVLANMTAWSKPVR